MTRKRPPEYDYICSRCLCACESDGSRHISGGSADFTACKKGPVPILRSEWKAGIKADVAAIRERMRKIGKETGK
jgi:hypothetical protein